MHFVVFFVTYAVGFDFLVVDSHKGARTNDIETSIELKELQSGGAIGTGLEFIEEKERVVGNELKTGIEQRDVFENRIYFETIVEDVTIFDLLHKVDFDYVLIVLGSKVLYGTCFSNLSRSFNDEWLSLGVIFPRLQISVYLSFENLFHIEVFCMVQI